MLENRKMMMRLFPELFATRSIRPVQHYPDMLLENLRAVGPKGEDPDGGGDDAGAYNSADFEHAFLAQQWGWNWSKARTSSSRTHGVHAYDPRAAARRRDRTPRRRRLPRSVALRKDSMIGVPGLFAAYRAGRVTPPTRSAPAWPTTSRSTHT